MTPPGILHATEPGAVFSMLDGVRLDLEVIEKTPDAGEGKEHLCEMKLFRTLHKLKKVRPCSKRTMGWEIRSLSC